MLLFSCQGRYGLFVCCNIASWYDFSGHSILIYLIYFVLLEWIFLCCMVNLNDNRISKWYSMNNITSISSLWDELNMELWNTCGTSYCLIHSKITRCPQASYNLRKQVKYMFAILKIMNVFLYSENKSQTFVMRNIVNGLSAGLVEFCMAPGTQDFFFFF